MRLMKSCRQPGSDCCSVSCHSPPRRAAPRRQRHPRRFNQIARLINAASQRSEPFVSVCCVGVAGGVADHRHVAVFQALTRAGRLAACAGTPLLKQTGDVWRAQMARSGLGGVGGQRGVSTPTAVGRHRAGSAAGVSPAPPLSFRSL